MDTSMRTIVSKGGRPAAARTYLGESSLMLHFRKQSPRLHSFSGSASTPRIARMLRELERPDTGQNREKDVAQPVTDSGGHSRKRTARQGLIATVTLIVAAFLAVIAWQARAAEMVEGVVTKVAATVTF